MKKIKRIVAFLAVFTFFITGTLGLVRIPIQAEKVYAETEYARGGGFLYTVNEDVYYSRKEITDKYVNPLKVPTYLSNYTCGITAGSVTIGYYDKDYPNLIPDFEPGSIFLGQWAWYNASGSNLETIRSLWSTLSADMNETPNGVYISNYLGGLSAYTARQGYTFNYSSNMTNGYCSSLNMDALKSAIRSGELISIFMDGFNLMSSLGVAPYNGFDRVIMEVWEGAHIMKAFGFTEIEYYNANNVMFRKDIYLNVHTGFSGLANGLLCVSSHVTIDDAYAVYVS